MNALRAPRSPFTASGRRLFVICGTSGDHFATLDGRLLRPDLFLYEHLRDAGFEHVVNVAHDRVYFFDEESERAVMAPPAAAGRAADVTPEPAGGLASAPGGLTLRRRAAARVDFAPRRFYRGLQDAPQDLAGSLRRALSQSEHPTAVVFQSVPWFLEEARGETSQMNLLRSVLMHDFQEHGGPDNRNVVIFRFPQAGPHELAEALRERTGLSWLFGLDGEGRRTGAAELVSFTPPGLDEVRALIDRAHLLDGLDVAWPEREDVETALVTWLRSGQGTLRSLAQWMADLSRLDARAAGDLTGESPAADLWAELDGLVGLEPVKAWFADQREAQEKRQHRTSAPEVRPASFLHRLVAPTPALHRTNVHMVFRGNPGLGKTSVARLAGRLLRSMGHLPVGHVVKVTRKDLVAGYVGQTALKTADAIERAIGGVLFVDEAYGLCGGEDDRFGREALETLLEAMSDREGELAVILAGYPREIDQLFAQNPGFKSRVPVDNHLLFPDATPAQLAAAFDRCVAGHPDLDGVHAALAERLEPLCRALPERHQPDFGNYRAVRTLVDSAAAQAVRRGARVLEARDLPERLQELMSAPALGEGGVLRELDDMVGLRSVKQHIQRLFRRLWLERMRGGPGRLPVGHMLFLGRPGTGKTTVAKLMARQLHALGFVERPELTECTAQDLIGNVVGDSTARTRRLLESGLGGVIFIDEAHQLFDPRMQHQGFGPDVLKTLLPFAANQRERCVVILAGYPEQMAGMLTFDDGLEGRFQWTLRFEDYDAEEMAEIFERFCRDNPSGALTVSPAATRRLRQVLAQLPEVEGRSFKNARSVRNLFEETQMLMARRLVEQGDGVSREALFEVRPEDIPDLAGGAP